VDTTQWISWYYQAVNQYRMLYVGYLLALVGGSALLWRRANNLSARGMFWTALPSAMLFAVLAVVFITRNQAHVAEALASYQQDAAAMLPAERVLRAEGNQSFRFLAVLWPSLSILAALAALVFARRPVVSGVGLGLVAVCMGTFLLDYFAYAATNDYLAHLSMAVAALP
jgi:uncharacterized integral membrane protein